MPPASSEKLNDIAIDTMLLCILLTVIAFDAQMKRYRVRLRFSKDAQMDDDLQKNALHGEGAGNIPEAILAKLGSKI